MYGQPVMMQPQMMPMQPMVPQIIAAPVPSMIPANTPPGLEFLLPTHQIIIEQQVEVGEMMLGINTNNRYHILDAWGRRMYFAAEDSDCCSLCCLGKVRPWNINIFNTMGQPVMQGTRDCGFWSCCGNGCQCMSTTGVPLGGVIQNCECVSASWNITDGTGQPVLLLQAPSCSVCCPGCATCFEADFPLLTIGSMQQIGKITKHFGGFLREAFTAADTFSCEFPVDLDAKLKAVLIYATFLIDFMYYEDVPENRRHRGGYY